MVILKVKYAMQPYLNEVSLKFHVGPEDKLIDAVRRMLLFNATRIAVMSDGNPVGVLDLDNALKKLGLKGAGT